MNNPGHLLPLLLLVIPLIWGIYGSIKTRKETKLKISYPGFATIINSAMLYALAFNLIFFIQELFLALGKKWSIVTFERSRDVNILFVKRMKLSKIGKLLCLMVN
jgi:hypothetical protein